MNKPTTIDPKKLPPNVVRAMLVNALDEKGDPEANMQVLALLAVHLGLSAYVDSTDPDNVQLFVAETEETFPPDVEDPPLPRVLGTPARSSSSSSRGSLRKNLRRTRS